MRLLLLLLTLASCTRYELDLEGLACDAHRCVEGYVCNEARVCVRGDGGDGIVTPSDPLGDGDDVLVDGTDADVGPGDVVDPADPSGDVDPGDAGDPGDGDPVDPCVGSPDLDDDGVCAALDCDDTIPTCTTDCALDTDDAGSGSPTPDCLEIFCGSIPDDAASDCQIVDSEAALLAALQAASSGGPANLLLGDVRLAGVLTVSGSDVVLRQRRGSVVRATQTANEGIVVSGDRITLSGLTLDAQENVKDAVLITGNDTTVADCRITRSKETGIYVHAGVRTRLLRNIVAGVLSAPANERGGIVLRDTVDAVVAGNVVAQNGGDGIQLRNAASTLLDHNTVASNGGSGVLFYSAASTGSCVRYNDLSHNAVNGVAATIGGNSWNVGTGCTGALRGGPDYGNNHFGNAATCGGSDCASCSCLPSSSFFHGSASPDYVATDLALPAYFCAASSQLVDGATEVGVDLNGEGLGLFDGSAPDVGAGDWACP
jgi:parallel beta-helix repeat protein